jgi:hypothetical protein
VMTKRGWWIALAVVVLAAAGFVCFVTGGPMRLTTLGGGERRAMLSLVPEGADEIIVVPGSGEVFRALRHNPMTQPALEEWSESHQNQYLPLLLGQADVVFWRNRQESGFVAAADPIRTLLARLYLRSGGRSDVAVNQRWLISGRHDHPLDPALVSTALSLSEGLRGNLFIILLPGSHFGYPPGTRPAVTALTLGDATIHVESRAAAGRARLLRPMPAALPAGALVSGAVDRTSEATRLLKSLPGAASDLLGQATGAAVYGVDEKKFIPRIHGILLFPAATRAAVLDGLDRPISSGLFGNLGSEVGRRVVKGTEIVRRRGLGYTIETAQKGDDFMVAFDKDSLERWLEDAQQASPWPGEGGYWCARIRPDLLWPVIEKLHGREELKLLSSDLYRDVDRAEEWSRWISNAGTAWVLQTGDGRVDVTRAVVVAKPK